MTPDLTADLFVLDGDILFDDQDIEFQGGCSCVLRITPAGGVTIEITRAEILAETGETFVHYSDNGLAVAANGTLYFTEAESDSLLVYPPGGPLATLVDESTFILANGSDDSDPGGVAFGSDGFLYVIEQETDDILRVDVTNGTVTVYVLEAAFEVLLPGLSFGPDSGIVGAENGILYVVNDGTDDISQNHVFEISAAGVPSILAAGNPPFSDLDVFIRRDLNNDLIVADDIDGDLIHRVTPLGVVTTFLSKAQLEDASCANGAVDLEGGIAFDSDGNFYIAEENSRSILRFEAGTPTCSTWVSAAAIELVTGAAPQFDGGIAFASAQEPVEVTAGKLYTESHPDGTDPEVDITLNCDSATVNGEAGAATANTVGGLATFTVTEFLSSGSNCFATEAVPAGYVQDLTDASCGVDADNPGFAVIPGGTRGPVDEEVETATGCHHPNLPAPSPTARLKPHSPWTRTTATATLFWQQP